MRANGTSTCARGEDDANVSRLCSTLARRVLFFAFVTAAAVGFSRHAAPADAHGSATGFLFRPDLVPLLKVACRESVQYVTACESIA